MSLTSSEHSQKNNQFEPHILALGTVGAVLASYTAFKLYKWSRKTRLDVPGKNEGYPFFGELSALREKGIRDFMQDKHDKYGEIFQAFVMGQSLVFLCSKDTIQWFEAEERKGNIAKPKDAVLGSQGILNQTGAPHKASRALFLKSVGPANLRSIFPLVESCVRECIAECLEKREFDDFLPQTKSLAWNIGTTLLFGDLITKDDSETILHSCHDMLTYINTATIKFRLPGTHWKRSTDARRRMTDIFERALRSRVHAIDTESGLFIDRLLAEHVEKYGTTEIMSEQMEYMTDQIIVFVLGSHETTASSLTNVMVILHEFPEYRRRFRELYDECQGNLDYNLIKKNVFISSFLTECMRVYSLSGISTRVLVKDSTYKQYTIPAGTKVIPGISVIHRGMGDVFDSARVQDVADVQSGKPNERFFGFGFGMHACAGKKLAYLEMSVAILAMCGICDWEMTSTPKAGKPGIMHHNFSCSFQPRQSV